MKKVKVGKNHSIGFLPYKEEDNFLFCSGAQLHHFDENNEDCDESFIDITTTEQIDELIDALIEIKESFPNKEKGGKA